MGNAFFRCYFGEPSSKKNGSKRKRSSSSQVEQADTKHVPTSVKRTPTPSRFAREHSVLESPIDDREDLLRKGRYEDSPENSPRASPIPSPMPRSSHSPDNMRESLLRSTRERERRSTERSTDSRLSPLSISPADFRRDSFNQHCSQLRRQTSSNTSGPPEQQQCPTSATEVSPDLTGQSFNQHCSHLRHQASSKISPSPQRPEKQQAPSVSPKRCPSPRRNTKLGSVKLRGRKRSGAKSFKSFAKSPARSITRRMDDVGTLYHSLSHKVPDVKSPVRTANPRSDGHSDLLSGLPYDSPLPRRNSHSHSPVKTSSPRNQIGRNFGALCHSHSPSRRSPSPGRTANPRIEGHHDFGTPYNSPAHMNTINSKSPVGRSANQRVGRAGGHHDFGEPSYKSNGPISKSSVGRSANQCEDSSASSEAMRKELEDNNDCTSITSFSVDGSQALVTSTISRQAALALLRGQKGLFNRKMGNSCGRVLPRRNWRPALESILEVADWERF